MSNQTFEEMLSGGHPNSLGRTLEVVAAIEKKPDRLAELYETYSSQDEVVRLRVSNALKRITRAHPDWVQPYLDRLISQTSKINQASTQWTLAQIFDLLANRLSPAQRADATEIMKKNLHYPDWIVLNMTMQTLSNWAKEDEKIRVWLLPELKRITNDRHKSVANKAKKCLVTLDAID